MIADRKALVAACTAILGLLFNPAHAQQVVLYSDGPPNYAQYFAFGESTGSPIADSLIIQDPRSDGSYPFFALQIAVRTRIGDYLSHTDWTFYDSNPFLPGAHALFGGTAFVVNRLIKQVNGFYVSEASFPIYGGVDCGSDGCGQELWIELSNGVSIQGGGVDWAESNGPSTAYQQGVQIPPESFQVFGSVGVPEPGVWALMSLGLCGIGATLRWSGRAALGCVPGSGGYSLSNATRGAGRASSI